jgi:hypothetical protein
MMDETMTFAGVQVAKVLTKEDKDAPKSRAPYEFHYAAERVRDAMEYIRKENPQYIEGFPNLEHWVEMFVESAEIEVEELKNVGTGTTTATD